ncbi:MAG: leucine-rich repeat domain-containing protein [Ruminococcus sp.]|nr:leucine-rich repeat domain-containing protein [Ruminococcus sp.]MCM1381649.1 leucine-rich repeat domain-containing protein [Muribaculaceae bacterium]
MKFKRTEHSRFIQRLDRTAEKNPLLWLPCVLLIALALVVEHIAEYAKIAYSHRNTEKVVKERPQGVRKPFALRAVAMSLVMAFSFMLVSDLGQVVFADEYYYNDMSNTDWQNDINVTGNDPFGNMLADEFNAKNDEQEANAGYNVFSVEMQGNAAVVDYEAIQNSTLVVGIYDELGEQLITTSSTGVTAEENQAMIEMDSSKIPQYFYIKAYLINSETMRPLCSVYECPTYTQEMQEFLSKTIYDFDADRVLNLDTDVSNNFAVFGEGAVISQETVNQNNVVSVDNDNNVYVIENADEIVKNLQSGDVYSQEYGSNEVLVVKVLSVDIVGDTVTIYGDDSSLEDVFEYVKIDSTFNSSDVVADTSTLEEGVEYEYSGGIAAYAVDVSGGVSYDHTFKFTDKDIENYKDGTTSAKVSLSGSLGLHLGGRAKLYISWSQTYVELVLDYSAKLQLTFSESLHGKIPLTHFEVSPCKGVFIKFDPSIVVEFDGNITLTGELYGSYGFKADKNGAHNISQSPQFERELSALGTFYIGVSLEPKVTIVSEKLVNAYIDGRMGVEVKASLKYGSTDEKNGIRHDCKSCIDGDISIKFNLNAGISLCDDRISFTIGLINKTVKIADFYRSDDFGDSGFTECPHYSYKVSAHIHGENSLLPGKTTIECSNGNVYTTDVEGFVDFYLPNGEYWFKISNDKYKANEYAEIKNKPTTISAWLNATFAHSSYGSGDTPIIPDPINPDPINPDPIDPDPVDPTPADSDFDYSILNGEVTIGRYRGKDTEVVIPNTIEGLPVTYISGYTFRDCTSLTNITIPNSVTYIGSYAFADCTSLTNITIPNSVTYIDNWAFEDCTSLTSITIPNSVTYIGDMVFTGCTSLTSINVDENNTSYSSLGDVLFSNDLSNLIQYPAGLIEKSYTIPNSVVSIETCAFYNCKSLTSITIPDSVETMGSHVFHGCTGLTSITIPDSVTSIVNETFHGCTSLASITIPDSVTSIGDSAFSGCTSLTSITIPDSVTFIGWYAFHNCISLTSITIPDSVTSIGMKAFQDCKNLTSITISNSVTSIPWGAFSGCTNLTSINIPNSVTSIGSYAFDGCNNLTIYCNSGSKAESYAIYYGVPYVIIDAPTSTPAQYELEETEQAPIIDTENNNDNSDVDDNDDLIENPEDTANNETDLQEIVAAVSEMPELYNSHYDEPMYFANIIEPSAYQTFTGLIPNEIYNCYGMKSRKADKPFNSSNLLFIAQGVSDSSGNLTFSYLPAEDYSNPEIFVKAMTEFDVDNAQIIFAEANDGSVSIGWNPADGASQYKIYKVVNNVYTEYQTTTSTSCTISGLSDNEKCGFIVQTCVNGEWSVLDENDILYYNASGEEHTHVFSNIWKSDDVSHWHECSCGEKSDVSGHTKGSGVITVKPTDETTGIMTYYCTVCDYVMETEVIPAIPDHTTHIFGTEWKSDNVSHWHECICGEKADNTPHSYDTGVITREPTETTEGIRTYTCTICGYIKNEPIPIVVPDHTVHTFGTKWDSDSTYHWHECTVCGVRSDETRHIEDNGTITVQPTATTSGTRTYSCTICGYVLRTEAIPPINDPYPVNPTPSYPTFTYPTTTTTTTSATNEPYIYGDSTKSGWNTVISEIDFAPDGSTVRVNMNGTTELPKEVTAHIQNRNINLELNIGSVVWTINGLDVTNPKTVNMKVSDRYEKIPASVMETIYSELPAIQLRLYHSGNFGFTAKLSLNVNKKYNGYYATLYYYNTKTKQLEYSGQCYVSGGRAEFEFVHASYYAIGFTSEPLYSDVSTGAGIVDFGTLVDVDTPVTNGVTIPAIKLPQIMKYSNKKRKYRILKKRRLDDLVFVL